MSLNHELALRRPLATTEHEAVLSIYYTAARLKKEAIRFLRPYGLTDVQLNLLMLLKYQVAPGGSLTQSELSRMMLVHPANVTTILDRLTQSGLVERHTGQEDRRFNQVRLTAKARRLLDRVEPVYARRVREVMASLAVPQQKSLIHMLEKVRTQIAPTA